ncbi:hypothetical protein [Streptomyces glaucescens]|uniref:hypothetical protein n=1 Tax=Streptomyces glaucescens TaxID=1907 RepID=UPI000A3A77BD|nr:hypothetical protein [Streptomyces glaucescens]
MPATSIPDLLTDEASEQARLDSSLRTWREQTGRSAPRVTIGGDDPAAPRDPRSLMHGWLTGVLGLEPLDEEEAVAARPVPRQGQADRWAANLATAANSTHARATSTSSRKLVETVGGTDFRLGLSWTTRDAWPTGLLRSSVAELDALDMRW